MSSVSLNNKSRRHFFLNRHLNCFTSQLVVTSQLFEHHNTRLSHNHKPLAKLSVQNNQPSSNRELLIRPIFPRFSVLSFRKKRKEKSSSSLSVQWRNITSMRCTRQVIKSEGTFAGAPFSLSLAFSHNFFSPCFATTGNRPELRRGSRLVARRDTLGCDWSAPRVARPPFSRRDCNGQRCGIIPNFWLRSLLYLCIVDYAISTQLFVWILTLNTTEWSLINSIICLQFSAVITIFQPNSLLLHKFMGNLHAV